MNLFNMSDLLHIKHLNEKNHMFLQWMMTRRFLYI